MRSFDMKSRHVLSYCTAAKIFLANHCSSIKASQNLQKMSFSTTITPPVSPFCIRIDSLECGNSTVPTVLLPPSITVAGASPNQSSILSIPRTFSHYVTPLASPCPSPPPILPSSGHLEEAKASLENAVAKRNTKASSLSIDEDMKDMCHYYSLLGSDERAEFLLYLCTEYCTNHEAVLNVVNQRPDPGQGCGLARWEERLRQSLQPPHAWVFTQISRLTGGVKFLVDFRHDLLVAQSKASASDEATAASLKELDGSLREMLSLWFTVGLLQLDRITWDSSCSMLQKISEYEAVHPVRNWADLKRRVSQYRRCFVFTHSCMPSEPLVVLHTFLTDSISSSMNVIVQNPRFDNQELLGRIEKLDDAEDSSTITAAVFYSITSTQKGLQGIELGNYLIKRVVQELLAELSGLEQFSSLSPIPGFVKWLHTVLAKASRGEMRIFTDNEVANLSELMMSSTCLSPPRDESSGMPASPDAEQQAADKTAAAVQQVCRRLRQMLATNSWAQDAALKEALKPPFMRLGAHYLYKEKRRGYALNSVANFHLKNGAVMWRLNYDADQSARGLTNSCGMMVNYRYFLSEAEDSSRRYQEDMYIAADQSVVRLAEQADDVMRGGNGVSYVSELPSIEFTDAE